MFSCVLVLLWLRRANDEHGYPLGGEPHTERAGAPIATVYRGVSKHYGEMDDTMARHSAK